MSRAARRRSAVRPIEIPPPMTQTLDHHAVRPEDRDRNHGDDKDPPRTTQTAARLESDRSPTRRLDPGPAATTTIARPARIAASPSEKKRHDAVETPEGDEAEDEDHAGENLVGPTQRTGPAPPPSPAQRRPPGADIERPVGAVGDAVEALHAPGIDNHAVITNLFVHPHVGGADRGAGCAAPARIGDADSDRRHPIGKAEGRSVGTAVGAVALGAENEDHRETADGKGQHGHRETREGGPEIRGQKPGCDRTEGLHRPRSCRSPATGTYRQRRPGAPARADANARAAV